MENARTFGEAAIRVLTGRKGFDLWWDDLDAEIQAEIVDELNSVLGALAAADELPRVFLAPGEVIADGQHRLEAMMREKRDSDTP